MVAYQSKCMKDPGVLPTGQECAHCHSEYRCSPGLICHYGVCRDPKDPDVKCQRKGFIFDYFKADCTDTPDPEVKKCQDRGRSFNFASGAEGQCEEGSDPSSRDKDKYLILANRNPRDVLEQGEESGGSGLLLLGALGLGIIGAVWLLKK